MYKIKDSIKDFKSYKPNNISYTVKLDANESSSNIAVSSKSIKLDYLERYPDHFTKELKKSIAAYQNVNSNEILIGNGSSEILELVVKTFVNPGDKVLSVSPSFVMYEKYTQLSNGVYVTVPVEKDMSLNIDTFIETAKTYKPKVVFLCTPNNPTGFILTKAEVIKVVKNIDAVIVVDEAYMEFAEKDQTVIQEVNNYPNLIIARTFSKAFGLAGIRLGYCIANKNLIETLSIPKTPYSVNTLSQEIGVKALDNMDYLETNKERVQTERPLIKEVLDRLNITNYTSNTNFIYCYFDQFKLAEELQKRGVLIRDFKNNYYRITIGTREENIILIQELEEIFNERSNN